MPDPLVAMFLPSLVGGGAEKVFALLANWLSGQGVEVHMVLGAAQGAWLERLSPKVQVEDLGCPAMRGAPSRLRRYLGVSRPQVAFSALTHANLALILASKVLGRFAGRVVVQEVQHLDRSRVLVWGPKERLFMGMARLLYPRADAVTTVSRSVARSLGRVPSLVLPNPLDLGEIQALATRPAEHPWLEQPGEGPPLVVAMGRLSAEKGFDVLLRALALACDRRPLRLLILGEGPQRARLEALVRELGLSDAVSLPGFIANPYACLARAELFVISSLVEGFSLALAEALACGCNVVTTACGQEPLNMVGDGRYGSIAPVNDAQALAQAMLQRLDNPLPADQLQFRAAPYGLEQVAPRYLDLLLPGWGHPGTET